jgi:hypothetical protein
MTRAHAIVNKLIEAGPDEIDPQQYLNELPSLNRERWVFTDHDQKHPEDCHAYDIFIAMPGVNDAGQGVQVERNGTVTNTWEDGTRGVPEEIRAFADDEDTLTTPRGEIADNWFDVYTDKEGNFVDWA